MDEQEIRDRILRAKGLKDIISLVDEMGIEDMGNQYRSMSVSQWYAYVNLGRYSKYNIFEIPKKNRWYTSYFFSKVSILSSSVEVYKQNFIMFLQSTILH